MGTVLYRYADYEEAYYNTDVLRCKEIGCLLLKRLSKRLGDPRKAQDLYKRMSKLTWSWEDPGEKRVEVQDLLLETKVFLMVWQAWL